MLQIAPILTDSGESLQIRALTGEQIIFTRMKIGSGILSSGETGKNFTDLKSPKISFGISSIEIENNYAKIAGVFDTTMITEDFNWTEFGIFCAGSKSQTFSGTGSKTTFTLTEKPKAVGLAKVGGSLVTISAYNASTGVVTLESAPKSGTNNVVIYYPDSTEQLYGYSYDPDAGKLRANITSSVAEQVVECVIAIGDASEVYAVLTDSSMYARKTDFDEHVNDYSNPHRVTKEQLGLDKIPNVATNDQTPTYEIDEENPPSLEPLESGEKMTFAFRKLAVAVNNLISHIKNKSNPHSVTCSQIGAAAASHTHSASEINSGVDTEPVAGSDNLISSGAVAQALNEKKVSTEDITSGILPEARGGTGSSTFHNSELAKVRNITLTVSGWSASVPYTQTATVYGMTSELAPIVACGKPGTLNSANYKALHKAFSMIDRAVTSTNTITFYCYSKKPTVDIPLVIKGV
jgi:hypothetical protein